MMNNKIIIRQETKSDFSQVNDVIMTAFKDMEESDHTEHLLVEKLRETDAYIPELSLVAEDCGGRVVGHILLSRVTVECEGKVSMALAVAPLSVHPDFQGRGIGGMLISEAHKRAAELGYGVAVLLGHKDYYQRFGYKTASLFGIKFPFETPDECCMVAELKSGCLNGIRGTVRYSEVFNAG